MYKLSGKQLAAVLGQHVVDDDSEKAKALEARIQRSLPAVVGLDEAETDAARLAVFSRTIERQRTAFIELYGSPFGEVRGTAERMVDTSARTKSLAVA